MNRLCCILSGGHKYSPTKIITKRNEINRTIEMKNFCVKCSKMISFEISDIFIDEEIARYEFKNFYRRSHND